MTLISTPLISTPLISASTNPTASTLVGGGATALHAVPEPMDLLASGVPLSLLMDLLAVDLHAHCGPNSARILAAEPGEADWLPKAARRKAATAR